MDKQTYNKIIAIYEDLQLTKKRVTKNDVLLKSLFTTGGTLDIEDIDTFFKIKKCPQKHFFNQMYIDGVNVFASGAIHKGNKKVGAFLRFNTVQKDKNVNDYLVNDNIYINEVGLVYAPEVKTNTCYMFY